MKRPADLLAVLGGSPAFPGLLHVGRPNVGDRDRLRSRIDAALDRRELTNGGPLVEELEESVRALAGVRHCVATCSATVGLQIAARALGLAGEVILPSFTFVGTPHALDWIGITPVFCDVSAISHTLDPERVKELIGPRTTAILGVHLWGTACDVAPLEHLARTHGLHLLFDAAHALGCTTHGRSVLGLGEVSVASLHATKLVNSFEGGAILTDDDEVARKARLLRSYGFAGYDEVVSEGTNAKMSEVAAAMGITSLESMDAFIAANRANYDAYYAGLRGLPGVHLREPPPGSSHHYVIVEIAEQEAGLSRDELVRVLHAEGVLARRYFHPGCHRSEPYRSRHPDLGWRLHHTEALCSRVLALPTGTAVSPGQIRQVCAIVAAALLSAVLVRARLGA